MNDHAPLAMPEITDGAIHQVCRLLDFPDNAFHGQGGDDPRRNVLICMDRVDVAACPGSGKTTLLVAKLALLASKWNHRSHGICVVSHTNAARREIQQRLGGTAVGRQLLAYPHYIGTIHGFINRFFAIPRLRKLGYPIRMIDTNVSVARRWESLRPNIRSGLKKNNHGPKLLCIQAPDFTFDSIRWGKGILSEETCTYRALQSACSKSIVEDGYHCYDEMFVWASDMLKSVPSIRAVIRERFPLLFIDEAQDNSEDQSSLLHRIFMEGGGAPLRQRFGDSNQSIYNFVGAEGASTDAFPCNDDIRLVFNSHRFGATIAGLAGPLGLVIDKGGIRGHGPKPICVGSCITECLHTIFLFEEDTIDKVLPSYADLLIETFSDEELRLGIFTAVGQVHKITGEDHQPRHVGHYWPKYDAELSRVDPQPQSFVQYVLAGQAEAAAHGATHPAVEMIARGILRLASMAKGRELIRVRKRSHRYVLELLDDHPEARNCYSVFVSRFALRRRVLNKRSWERRWSDVVRDIGRRITGVDLSNADADAFLKWNHEPCGANTSTDEKRPCDNTYHYPADDPRVQIKVGSVHSVKGQTHTATLVLETFWHDHNLEKLREWIIGEKTGWMNSDGERQKSRLQVHYVAMTRPTHLLCLAMKHSSFENGDGELDSTMMQRLRAHGWRIQQL